VPRTDEALGRFRARADGPLITFRRARRCRRGHDLGLTSPSTTFGKSSSIQARAKHAAGEGEVAKDKPRSIRTSGYCGSPTEVAASSPTSPRSVFLCQSGEYHFVQVLPETRVIQPEHPREPGPNSHHRGQMNWTQVRRITSRGSTSIAAREAIICAHVNQIG
jgi:hypothetical protein